jgi:spectinomycin phosphotransferase
VKDLPQEFDADVLGSALADGWDFDVEAAEYAPLGAGSYHWAVRDRTGARAFATVDDLDQKSWLGDARDAAFDGLRVAFDTAAALLDAGLAFVVAPIRTTGGESVRRIGPRHTVALFPFVDGRAEEWGEYETVEDRAAVVAMLAELHRATRDVGSVAGTVGVELPGREHIETAIRELDEPWTGGPFAEPARHALAEHASDVADLLALADRFAADVQKRGGEFVVTHGEPHRANVMRTADRRMLVDWDTVALAPPERDLWMVVSETGDEAAAYADATGRRVDAEAMDFFRLTWDLKDLAECLNVLRAPHMGTDDTVRVYGTLAGCVTSRSRWESLL